ncbi:MAG: mannitol-1-phosphate 5-dehydrogenase [Bacteroidia bacterium]|nr:mannitol-1-phosphate 5-dehydrogenase [Bacteroidia bacterium]
MKKLVLFGAGKIGRSFIGQLFATSGFEVVFVDVIEPVIRELNRLNEYKVIIKSSRPDEIIRVGNVRGVLGNEVDMVAEELSVCDIAAISVGQKGLPLVIPTVAKGLILRQKKFCRKPLDIILAENMHNADQFVKDILRSIIGSDYPIDDLVGLIETSIGKMVPIMPQEEQEKDLLLVYAEPYNTLILDKKAFKNPIPDVKGLAPKDNMKAWVDRKSHIHNFGHAAAAYKGFLVDPTVQYLADILKIPSVKKFTRSAMLQSADVLMRKYPGEFTLSELTDHIDDLLDRFGNSALGDTVFRVGCDLKRKLHRNDRILSPLIDGIQTRSPVNKILLTFAYGLCFRAKDEYGNMFPGDVEFSKILYENGLSYVLTNLCSLSPTEDRRIITHILSISRNVLQKKIT